MSDTTRKTAEAVEKQAAAAGAAAQETVDAARAMIGEGLNGLEMAVPESMRSLAETTVSQSREAYERTKGALEDTVETLEKSFDRAGRGAAALNRKVIDITQTNMNSSFDLAKSLAGARTLAEIVELQAAFARTQFERMTAQAEEMRELSVKLASETAEPFKAHVTRSVEAARPAR